MTPFYIRDGGGDTAYLEGEEALHSTKVLRKKVGDEILGVDGKGQMLLCRVSALGKGLVELEILERHRDWGEKPQRISILVSPLHKPDRLEWLIEKSVELGVTDIYPYLGKHTVKTGLRADRLERIMIAALKQCMRSQLPKLHTAAPLKAALAGLEAEVRLIATAEAKQHTQDLPVDWVMAPSAAILVGPEGDFSQEELDLAIGNRFQSVSLGQNRLRSETAAIHLLGLVKNFMRY
ncbi:MAG: RsmE family RNA methyltransferase [Bacteroidia bacterium]